MFLSDPTLIAPGVWTMVTEPDTVTVGVVAGADGAVVIDCGSSAEQGREIRDRAGQISGVPVIAAVLTHAHHDHAFGLAAFEDLITIGHESLDQADTGSAETPRLATTPNRPIVVATALELGGRRVEVAHLGRGHTEGDLLVVVPDADLVFAGDLVESATPPWYGPDSFPQDWPVTVDGLIGLMTEQTRAVPGHGDPVDRQFVFGQRGELSAVAGLLEHLAGTGVSLDEAGRRDDWPIPVDHVIPWLEAHYRPSNGPVGRRPDLPLA